MMHSGVVGSTDSRRPRTSLAVVGRFHGFDLARELDFRGYLHRFMSTYPRSTVSKWGVPQDRAIGEPFLEFFRRYGSRIPLADSVSIDMFVHRNHAKNAARHLVRDADIFIGWTGSSLEALIEARNRGVITVLERGSSHASEWRELMATESARFGSSFNPMYDFWQRELLEYQLADYISIPSSFVKNTFIKHGVPEHKLLVNPYGVDLESFRPTEKEDDKFRIISVGGFNMRKGSRYLLQAFSELDIPDVELWHVGTVSPEMKPFIERFADERVTFWGHKPQAELYKFYSQASVFVLMSIEEGMAMVQCQAMACGLPLICSTNTGGADLIGSEGEAGIVVNVGDVEALKASLMALYHEKERCRTMGEAALRRIGKGLTWSNYGDRYAANLDGIWSTRNASGEFGT